MIAGKLKNYGKYACLGGARFRKAFEFLRKCSGKHTGKRGGPGLKDGIYEIRGRDVYAIASSYKTASRGEKKFESHRKYADIQFLVSGREVIEWSPAAELKLFSPYNPQKDAAFYKKPAQTSLLNMSPGIFAVFFPGDGHMPGCAAGRP